MPGYVTGVEQQAQVERQSAEYVHGRVEGFQVPDKIAGYMESISKNLNKENRLIRISELRTTRSF